VTEPRSNMTLTDHHGLARYRRDEAVNALVETANRISDAMTVLTWLARHDTEDKVCGEALSALEDDAGYLDDVITALNDGRLAEPGDAG
jgi:hypothetical protein